MPASLVVRPLLAAAAVLVLVGAASAQDDDLHAWTVQAATGAFDLCRADAPDAAAVEDHGEVWGWPTFVGYLEHPEGFHREAGGESRRSDTVGDKTVDVELGVQSGQVTSAAPAEVRYFRCNVAVNEPINEDLEAYFTRLYGPPAARSDTAVVWLVAQQGVSLTADAVTDEDAAIQPVANAAPGAGVLRVELTRERGLDRAKLTIFRHPAPS